MTRSDDDQTVLIEEAGRTVASAEEPAPPTVAPSARGLRMALVRAPSTSSRVPSGVKPALTLTTRACAGAFATGARAEVPTLPLDAPDTLVELGRAESTNPTDSDRRHRLQPAHAALLVDAGGARGATVVPHTGLASLSATAAQRFVFTGNDRVLMYARPGSTGSRSASTCEATTSGRRTSTPCRLASPTSDCGE